MCCMSEILQNACSSTPQFYNSLLHLKFTLERMLLIRYSTDCYLLWFDSVTVTKPSPEDRESVRHVSAEKSASSRRRKRCSSPSPRRSPQHQAHRNFCVHIDLIVLTINLCGKTHHVYTLSNGCGGLFEIVETLSLSTCF